MNPRKAMISTTLAGALTMGIFWPHSSATEQLPLGACVQEDSPGPCAWDASQRGNKKGNSFIRLFDQTQVPLQYRTDRDNCILWVGPTSLLACPNSIEES